MSEFNLIWRKYGLRANPYFNSPLTIDGGTLPISAFIGRENEQQQLRSAIKLGGEVRCLIVGDPGVGKTSLVNYVRSQAAKNGFFTPSREIEINRVISGNEFIILTLSSIFDEIKRRDIQLPEHLHDQLDAFYMLNSYGENFMEVVNTSQLNRQKLISLFQNVVKELVNPRFKGLILHYDNLDNIEDDEGIVDMFSDIRDFLLTKDIVFFFVGDHYTAPLIPV
ncbi:MAG: AAA family ATPase, partial [Candidatus Nanoarchaeia archaeon]